MIIQSGDDTIILPEPLFGDLEGNPIDLQVKRSLTGNRYSYIKIHDRRQFEYSFDLSYSKGKELLDFYRAHSSDTVLWIIEDVPYTGIFIDEPYTIKYGIRSDITIKLETLI